MRKRSRGPRDGRRRRLVQAVVRPLQAFLRLQAASGIVLFCCGLTALAWANVDHGSYTAVFDAAYTVGDVRLTLRALINEGLMTVFFFVVGMEIKREIVAGDLDSVGKATLPAIAALGGMILPAALYLVFNQGGSTRSGWGIPTATDIAFSLGVLALLGDRVPRGLAVFLTALAIFDDIGGILLIAVFYGHGMQLPWLAGAGAVLLALVALNRLRVTREWAYVAVGGALWYALHHAGIHPTIAGVAVGLSLSPRRHQSEPKPATDDVEAEQRLAGAPLARLISRVHPFVAYLILPLFAVANVGVSLRGGGADLATPVALGVTVGLVAGKALGIFAFTWLGVHVLRVAPLPGGGTHRQLFGVSMVAGIGFTVALFIAALAFRDAPALLAQAKLGILAGSFVAGCAGYSILRFGPRSRRIASPAGLP